MYRRDRGLAVERSNACDARRRRRHAYGVDRRPSRDGDGYFHSLDEPSSASPRAARARSPSTRDSPPRDRVDDDLDDLDGDDAVPVHEPRVATRTDDPDDDWDHPADAAVRAEWESYWRNLRARRRLAEHGTRRRWPGPLITIGEWGRGYDTERPDRWTPRVVSRSRESRDTYPHAAPASAPAAAAADPTRMIPSLTFVFP